MKLKEQHSNEPDGRIDKGLQADDSMLGGQQVSEEEISNIAQEIAEEHYERIPNAQIDETYRQIRIEALKELILNKLK